MQTLPEFRAANALTLEGLALAIGLSANAKGHLSRIENGEPAPLRLALRIQQFTAGAVPADSLVSDEDRALLAIAAKGAPAEAVTA